MADGVFDCVSGTFGLTGVANMIVVLIKKDAGHNTAIRGRDIEDETGAAGQRPTAFRT
jgi:hypothetical protein